MTAAAVMPGGLHAPHHHSNASQGSLKAAAAAYSSIHGLGNSSSHTSGGSSGEASFPDWNALDRLRPDKISALSWRTFVDPTRLSLPSGVPQWSTRVTKNASLYLPQYVLFVGLLAAYSLLTHWTLLLVVLLTSAGFALLFQLPRDQAVPLPKPLDRFVLTWQKSMLLWSIISLTFLFMASAGSILFWVVGASAITIGLHASLHQSEDALGLPESKV